jgi:hypothetical protein
VIRADLGYLDPKEFPLVKEANPKDFFDNSFVDNLKDSLWGLILIGLRWR